MSSHKEKLKQAMKMEILARLQDSPPAANGLAVLSPAWLYEELLPSLSPKEEKALEEIIGEMVQEGLITGTGGRKPTYQLTLKGKALMSL